MDDRKKKADKLKGVDKEKKPNKIRPGLVTSPKQKKSSQSYAFTRRQDEQEEETRLLKELNQKLKAFPPACSPICEQGQCDDVHDPDSSLELELEDFEQKHLPDLKKLSTSILPRSKKPTLLHVLVNEWSKDERWSTKKKSFLHWMLQQKDISALLMRKNEEGFTPMHLAFKKKLEEFVTCALEADQIENLVDIFKIDSPSIGNCLHVATRFASPNLEHMIGKFAHDDDVFISKDKSDRDTPLHIAVKDLGLLVEDQPSESPAMLRPESESHDTDVQSDQGNYDHVGTDFSHDSDQEDSDYIPSSGCSDDDGDSERGYSEGDDDEIVITGRYIPANDEEREKILLGILLHLEKETVRPRPHHDKYVNRTDPGVPGEDALPKLIELPTNHSVRLLVEANSEALEISNGYGRTPYLERVQVLLEDPMVRSVISRFAERNKADTEARGVREDWAMRMIIAKDPVAHYIRSFCLHNLKSREKTMSSLYQPGRECHIEFDLAGMPNTVISQAYLDQLAFHLKFESILRYVALPALSIEREAMSSNHTSSIPQPKQPMPHRAGRSDLVTVFDWLWRNGVREIIKVMIVDDRDVPHADTSIVEALHGFKVEEWDWKRVDLCSDVIAKASPTVREVSLYSSGNNAVLMGWASPEGLGNRQKFPYLERVTIYVKDGWEDQTVRNKNTDTCKANILKFLRVNRDPNSVQVEIIPDKNKVSYSSEFYDTTDERNPPWIESIQCFSTFIKGASDTESTRVAPVKIAIIDDGIDATVLHPRPHIVGGATFCPYPRSTELVNSYFVPSGKHGTLMAQLVCTLCPDAQFYIARLEELAPAVGSGRRITASSAAKAIEWAINCGVNIISMSWTIQSTEPTSPDMEALKSAITRAHSAQILMFCSASDQGGSTPERCYPGEWEMCLRIGGATFAGDKLSWVNDEKVDFWFPGRNYPFPGNDEETVVYESGSSVATAAATGLAAVLLYASRLAGGNDTQIFQDRDKLKGAFQAMVSGSGNKFPRTTTFLSERFKEHILEAKKSPDLRTVHRPQSIDINTLSWDKVSREALIALLRSLRSK